MTNEEQIEEILFEAHAHGVRDEVMELANQMLEKQGRLLNRVDAYQQALQTLTVD
tara:strand:+ start:746 stop:910 length:165 start_codon:yes stop_codon:yes gene_type:complete